MGRNDTRDWITNWAFRGLLACACGSASLAAWLAARLVDSFDAKMEKVQEVERRTAVIESDVRHLQDAVFRRRD